MEKKNPAEKAKNEEEKNKLNEVKPEKEFDADEEVHKTSPDLIQKEDHHLPVDDEVKEG
ncbi:MAG: hypothetical protein JWQ30_234 [Sediminibacterium sp.]|nr:hypothetical protein [Sediminibacterium sp.]